MHLEKIEMLKYCKNQKMQFSKNFKKICELSKKKSVVKLNSVNFLNDY